MLKNTIGKHKYANIYRTYYFGKWNCYRKLSMCVNKSFDL